MYLLIHSPSVHSLATESLPFQGAFIIKHVRIVVAAALLASATLAAQAQSTTAPDTRWHFGMQVGTVRDHADTEPVAQLTFGYDIDSIWSVEALLSASLLFERDGGALRQDRREFDDAVGARVLAALPLSERWKLLAGLGLQQLQDERGLGDGQNETFKKTGALVSLAAMYRANRHWSMGLEASTFAQSHTLNLGLRGEIHF